LYRKIFFNLKSRLAQDDKAIEPNRVRKSIGAENSFAQDLSDKATILQELEEIARTLHNRLEKHQATGRTLTLKVKFSNYQQITRSKTLLIPINDLNTIITEARTLLDPKHSKISIIQMYLLF